MLKFQSGKTGNEDVKVMLEAFALVPAAAQHMHGGPRTMAIDAK